MWRLASFWERSRKRKSIRTFNELKNLPIICSGEHSSFSFRLSTEALSHSTHSLTELFRSEGFCFCAFITLVAFFFWPPLLVLSFLLLAPGERCCRAKSISVWSFIMSILSSCSEPDAGISGSITSDSVSSIAVFSSSVRLFVRSTILVSPIELYWKENPYQNGFIPMGFLIINITPVWQNNYIFEGCKLHKPYLLSSTVVVSFVFS